MNGSVELVRKLGDGSVVEAFLGRAVDGFCLVQISRPGLSTETALLQKLVQTSAALVAAPEHPELIRPRRATTTLEGRLVVRSDSITGWTAADLLRLQGPMREELVVEWGIVVCEALASLHDAGRVHGCLAPRHLHVGGASESPSIRLADTTLLHFRGEKSSLSLPKELTVVEPEYLSPERAGGSRATVASDVWGVGALLVELLTGKAPYRGATHEQSRALALEGVMPRARGVLARWKDVIDGTLDPRPLNRLGSALELRQALLALC
jgi:serine/threonine-protein kinase